MKRRATQQTELLPRRSSDEVYAELGFSRTPTVDGVMASYIMLPKNEITPLHRLHHDAMHYVLWGALGTYSHNLNEITSAPRVSQRQLRLVTDDFNVTAMKAKKIAFPTSILKPLSFDFIDFSLHQGKGAQPAVRKAAATMGLAVGSDLLHDAKVAHILEQLNIAMKKEGKMPDGDDESSASLAKNMLEDLGESVYIKETPSVIDVAATYTKEHARSIALKAAVAAVAASIFTPSIANANEPIPPIIHISQGADQVPTVKVEPIVKKPGDGASRVAPITLSPETPIATPITIKVTPSHKEIDEKQKPAEIVITPEKQLTPPPVVEVKPSIPTTPAPLPDGTMPSVPNVSITPEKTVDPSSPDQSTLTPEQKSAQTITSTLYENGEISDAASQILETFGTVKKTTIDENGDTAPGVTNAGLLKNITALEQSYKDLIVANGHADIAYINTSLMALAVLEAATQDQTVLDSKEVQSMISQVVAPTDAYQLRLYNDYLTTAKTTLETNDNGALIAGFDSSTDPKVVGHKKTIETLYAYALMADTTDVDQSSKIQSMKDADAKAAAEAAAAKAAAEAAAKAKAQEQAGGTQSVSAEAIATLISKETDPVKKTMFVAMQFFINNGFTPEQAAGIIGNLHRESASTMDPSIHQRGGPAVGLAQWEGGRAVAEKAFATSRGKAWDDLETQLSFIVHEMNTTRRGSLGPVQSAKNIHDAAYAFMRYFETPYVVIHGTSSQIEAETALRAARGQGTLDAYNTELQVVTDARAAEAKAKAEQAAHMSSGQEIMNNLASKYKNGELPPEALKTLEDPHVTFSHGEDNLNSDYYDQVRHFGSGSFELNPEAADQLVKLAKAYSDEFDTTLTIAAAYRTVEVQKDQKEYWKSHGKPGNAAAPGHSNHGWGLAMDVHLAGGAKGAQEHKWLVENAPKYGWVWPRAAGELWHFEYVGSTAKQDGAHAPQPGLRQR